MQDRSVEADMLRLRQQMDDVAHGLMLAPIDASAYYVAVGTYRGLQQAIQTIEQHVYEDRQQEEPQ